LEVFTLPRTIKLPSSSWSRLCPLADHLFPCLFEIKVSPVAGLIFRK
jgi:hypothetical protein